MQRDLSPTVLLMLFVVSICQPATAEDWPVWRGPRGDNTADPNQNPPITWSQQENLIWSAPVPGRGHSSPILVNGRLYLTTADEQEQSSSVLCYDAQSGQQVWSTVLHQGGFQEKIHPKNTHASSTLACDGSKLYAVFIHKDNVMLTALNLKGQIAWQKKTGVYLPKAYQFGGLSTPLLYESSIIVASESEPDSYLAAFDVDSGDELWRTKRPAQLNWSTPIVADVAGQPQLLLSGGNAIRGYNPNNGTELWAAPSEWAVSCGTMVWHEDLVFASGGFPKKATLAVKADGSGEVVWKNDVKCYEQSLLVAKDHVYAVDDNGIAFCWNAKTGTEQWKARLRGPVSASPVLVGDKIYATNERGTTFVFRADPTEFQELARNQLGTESFATPVIANSRIYTRIATNTDGSRQEYLVCLGAK